MSSSRPKDQRRWSGPGAQRGPPLNLDPSVAELALNVVLLDHVSEDVDGQAMFSEEFRVPAARFHAVIGRDQQRRAPEVLTAEALEWVKEKRSSRTWFCVLCRKECNSSRDVKRFFLGTPAEFVPLGVPMVGIYFETIVPHCDNARCKPVAERMAKDVSSGLEDSMKHGGERTMGRSSKQSRAVDVYVSILTRDRRTEPLYPRDSFKKIPQKVKVPEAAFVPRDEPVHWSRLLQHVEDPVMDAVTDYCQAVHASCCNCGGAPMEMKARIEDDEECVGKDVTSFKVRVALGCEKPECIAYVRSTARKEGACDFCGRTSDDPKRESYKKCSRCKTAIYCSGTCQQADWDRQKQLCGLPSSVAKDVQDSPIVQIAGSSTEANQEFASESSSSVSNGEQSCANCGSCAPPGKRWPRCSKCQRVSYCSKECQRGDWKIHKLECD